MLEYTFRTMTKPDITNCKNDFFKILEQFKTKKCLKIGKIKIKEYATYYSQTWP